MQGNVKWMFYPYSSEDRIRNGVRKLERLKEGATQGRLDTFFKAIPSSAKANKRKVKLE